MIGESDDERAINTSATDFPDHDISVDTYRLEDQVGFLLRRAHQRYAALFTAQIAELTPPQFATLARLREIGQTSQNQLGTLVAMDAATIKGVIDRLHARDFVALSRDDDDRRRVVVTLTPLGHATVQALLAPARAIMREAMAPLTGREAGTFLRLLAKMG